MQSPGVAGGEGSILDTILLLAYPLDVEKEALRANAIETNKTKTRKHVP